ncbi:UNVERIFIED_CONTAM: hypothetical protein RKD43_007142 [Streptomyces graminofaciens]
MKPLLIRFAAPARAISQVPARIAASASVSAVRAPEQAVSRVMLGPVKS